MTSFVFHFSLHFFSANNLRHWGLTPLAQPREV